MGKCGGVRGSTSSIIAPELDIINEPENEKIFVVEDFIRRNYDGNFKFDTLHNDKAIELLLNVDKTNNNITFKPLEILMVYSNDSNSND